MMKRYPKTKLQSLFPRVPQHCDGCGAVSSSDPDGPGVRRIFNKSTRTARYICSDCLWRGVMLVTSPHD